MNSFYPRNRLLVLAVFLAALPVAIYGARQAFHSTTNRVEDWLPAEFEETQRLLWFAERFGQPQFVIQVEQQRVVGARVTREAACGCAGRCLGLPAHWAVSRS